MKKVIIIAMLLSILCVCGLSAGVCFADETSSSQQIYYFEKSQATPNLPMRASASEEGKVLLYIPHSYAFEKLEEPSGGFVKVNYNGQVGYIQTVSFNNNCKQVTSKWGNNAYAYNFLDVTVTESKVTLYSKDNMTNLGSIEKDLFTINKVYGYYFLGNDYYFLADTTTMVFGNPNNVLGYVKATDTSLANFKAEDIEENAGYVLQTTPEQPSIPSGEINSGNTNPPSLDNNGTDTQTPKNSLDRYILIAVIAVLCVVIIILIFVPNKKKQN